MLNPMKKRSYRQIKAPWLTAALWYGVATIAARAGMLASWDFAGDMQGWKGNLLVTAPQHSADGLTIAVKSPDPFLTSPAVDCPPGQFLAVTLRMRSTGNATGQLYAGPGFSESRSWNFRVKNDGAWHEYRILIPSPGTETSFRLDPSTEDGTVSLAWLRIESFAEPPAEAWAAPRELRDKKIIGGGLYTTHGGDTAITPRFLAQHPDFAGSYPFDGIVLPAPLSPEWVKSLGLTKMGMPWLPAFLNELLWNKILIPDEAVAQTIADLKTMERGSLTDNFLIFGMVDGARGLKTPDLADDTDWAFIEHNARLAARICRDGNLKGFWLDTEQYGVYRWRTGSGTPEFDPTRPQELPFPLGKDTPEVLRRRGAEWIKAVQAEFPEVKIMTTFAWSPDSNSYGPLTGVIPFLDGVLEGITAPGQIIHGHENTFYFGHAKGTTHTYATENGFPGDRNRYDSAQAEIRGWRSLSNNPAKYDTAVQVGMAAWVEDHPWNVPEGWPIGSKASLWSNLPLALAYADEYVWVWSEHTKYGQPDLRAMNPFLASLNNQTFNTKEEPVASFSEDFATDPMPRGWYFDFDMLAIGRKAAPDHEAAVMSVATLPYHWDRSARELKVTGINPTHLHGQRQRFVRPLSPGFSGKNFQASVDFRIDTFGTSEGNPMLIGLFSSEGALEDHSVTLQIEGPARISIVIHSGDTQHTLPLAFPEGIKTGQLYRLGLDFSTAHREFRADLRNLMPDATPQPLAEVLLPGVTLPAGLDEAGIALFDAPPGNASSESAYQYAVVGFRFSR